MKPFVFKYFFPTDNLYIQIGRKKSACGDDEFQDDIVLFRDIKTSELVGIDIMHFSKSKTSKIKTSEGSGIDFTIPFRLIKALVSLEDIRLSDPDEFEKVLAIWGYKIRRKCVPAIDFKFKKETTPQISISNADLVDA